VTPETRNLTSDAPHPATDARRTTPSPIADLSYRGYDGPLHTRFARWWIVALAGIRLVRKKPGFWILVALCAFPFLLAAIRLYIESQVRVRGLAVPPNPLIDATTGQKYASAFFQAYSGQQLMLFVAALLVGAGSIAADNRANALLVYLSKPITKGDYLLGKWMGVFLTLFGVAFAPAFLLYLYCLLSYGSDGFLRDEPLLWGRVLLAAMVPAAVHASLILGFSAWSKTPRMAGAIYAAFYFISGIVAAILWGIRYHGDIEKGVLLRHLSVSGVIEGLGQNIYGVTMHTVGILRRHHEMRQMTIPMPALGAMLGVAAALILLGVLATRLKIRAVEVVRG
jgi:ABC-2 type transport system permease protein